MHVLLAAVLVLQAATVIDVQANHTATLALQFGDTIYTAEFSLRDLKPDSLKDGDRVQAEVKGGHMTVQRKDGRKVSGNVIQVQRVLVHPLPAPSLGLLQAGVK
jgi:ribosomal protein L14